MLKDAGRGDMLAKFLGGGLSRRPLTAAAEMLPTGEIGRGIVGMQRGAPGNRMAAGLVQELSGRRVPPSHPWYKNVVSNRGIMQAPQAELKPRIGNSNLLKAAALMGMTRMIPGAAKTLSKKAPAVATMRAAAGGGGLASQMRQAAKAPARPLTPPPAMPAAGPAPVSPISNAPAGAFQPRPTVLPPNPNSTFDQSLLGQFMPKKMASLRVTPIARLIAGLPARRIQF